MAVGLADALAHVHAHGFVHRDIKPANILLEHGHKPRLADFGIARALDGTVVTATGAVAGTAAYLAPEQVRGEVVEPSVDIFALGLVLIEALTGQREYPGTMVESATARLHRRPVVPEGLPPAFAAVLAAMTDLDPAARPSAAAVVTALTGPEVAEPAPVRRRVAWARHAVLAAAALLVALLGGVALLVGGGRAPSPAVPVPDMAAPATSAPAAPSPSAAPVVPARPGPARVVASGRRRGLARARCPTPARPRRRQRRPAPAAAAGRDGGPGPRPARRQARRQGRRPGREQGQGQRQRERERPGQQGATGTAAERTGTAARDRAPRARTDRPLRCSAGTQRRRGGGDGRPADLSARDQQLAAGRGVRAGVGDPARGAPPRVQRAARGALLLDVPVAAAAVPGGGRAGLRARARHPDLRVGLPGAAATAGTA